MASNNLAEPFRTTTSPPILKPWSRWSWKTSSIETAPESPPRENSLNSTSNSTLEASITTSKLHPRSTSSETIKSAFSSSSKEEANFSYDGSYSSSSDDEEISFDFNNDMSTQASDNSSQSSVSQPSTPGKSERSRSQSSPAASETGDSMVESKLTLLFNDAPELKSMESITIITLEGKNNNEEEREEHTVAGNGLKDEELSPREIAFEKRRIMIKKLISGRKDELGVNFLGQLSYNRVGLRFGGWSAYPEFTYR